MGCACTLSTGATGDILLLHEMTLALELAPQAAAAAARASSQVVIVIREHEMESLEE